MPKASHGLKVTRPARPPKTPEEIAAITGFESVEHLRAESKPLLKHDCDKQKSCLAHSPLGYCFTWDDESLNEKH
jgi:hypothetical protein